MRKRHQRPAAQISRDGPAEIRRVRLVFQERTADVGLPFVAYGLSRMRLDASLLDLAAREGAEVRRGAGVRSLVRADGGPCWPCSPTGDAS